jgi:hypothetical protein
MALLALILGACAQGSDGGGVASLSASGGGAPTTTVARSAKDFEDARLEWAKCMRENGVDVPDPGADGRFQVGPGPGSGSRRDLRDDPDFDKAQKACEKLLEGFTPPNGFNPEQMKERVLALAKCLRDHGFDVPDPQFDQGARRFTQELPKGIDVNSKEFRQAQQDCAKQSGLDQFGKGPQGGPAGARTGTKSGSGTGS